MGKLQLTVTANAEPDRVVLGQPSRDRVVIGGALASWNATVSVRVYIPLPTQAAIRCDGVPASETSFAARGSGTFTTPLVTVDAVGWYTYRLEIPGDDARLGVTAPCAVPAESFRVEVQPRVTTVVSSTRVEPGTAVTDLIRVAGLSGQSATIRALPLRSLFDPRGDRLRPDSALERHRSGDRRRSARDGARHAGRARVLHVPRDDRGVGVRPGDRDGLRRGLGDDGRRRCPSVATQVSAQRTAPGAAITDRVVVTGLGVLRVTVAAELHGPFATRAAIRCDTTPAWSGTFVANGDGTYTTAPFRVERAAHLPEVDAEGPANAAARTECGEEAETTLARATPTVTTLVSEEVVVPGSRLHDTVRVSGLGRTPAVVELELFGPFASRDAIRCSGAPFWSGRMAVTGDGVYRSQSVVVQKSGFYSYRERLVATALVAGRRAECGVVAETSLARPLILTGGRAIARGKRGDADAGGRTPRVRAGAIARYRHSGRAFGRRHRAGCARGSDGHSASRLVERRRCARGTNRLRPDRRSR